MIRRILAGWLALTLCACAGPSFLNTFTPASGYNLATNVVFDPEHQLRLDVYTPNGADHAPVVIFFFGEGDRWTQGIKDDYEFVGQSLAARGFVAVIPNYRLYPGVRFPAFLYDNAMAVRWAHEHAESYGGDADKLVVMGHGAGAYNAAMLACDPDILQHVGGDRGWLRAMIGLAGPYEFLPIVDPDLRDLFGPPERFDQTQPGNFVDGRVPPMLLMTGVDDKVVPAQNTRALAEHVVRAGGSVETVIYPKMSHRWILSVLSSTLSSNADVMDHVVQFVTKQTSGPRRTPMVGPQSLPGGLPNATPAPLPLPAPPVPSSSAPLYAPVPAASTATPAPPYPDSGGAPAAEPLPPGEPVAPAAPTLSPGYPGGAQ